MATFNFSTASLTASAAIFFVVYQVVLIIYRLYFSPLAKFPGPKLAAATLWYEFYYDVICRGQYTFHIKKLHEKYGSIIRINPYELHVSDPEFYDSLYASSASKAKRDKWEWYTKQFGTPGAAFSTTSHDQHKIRRAALNRYFSVASVQRLQPVIQERVDKLVQRLIDTKDSHTLIPLEYALAAFTNDVVVEYSYGESEHRLESPTWGPEYHDAVVEAGSAGSLMKQMFWIFDTINSLPTSMQAKLSPSMELILRIQEHVEGIIKRIKSQSKPTASDAVHPTIFHEILQNASLPESDKTVLRLKSEALIVVGAGTLTTSWALCVAIYHLLATPRILAKLKAELKAAISEDSTNVPLARLEQLPYLNAIVQEALRLSYGVASRLQRIPHESLPFNSPEGKTWLIPPGTPVGMTSVLLHHDESIFPKSNEFSPERWLENPRLDKYLVAFSKGSRQCLGINLAYAEMRLCLFGIFRRFGSSELRKSGLAHEGLTKDDIGILDLFETTIRDVEIVADGFIPLRAEGSKGVRIQVGS